ncbi:uncharacterized protein [Amphiura filiformis]|uniref:uncharacterized protein n=1 Tax=Amphiura filiformis TaxID=82378 RepID=UPI003B21D67C
MRTSIRMGSNDHQQLLRQLASHIGHEWCSLATYLGFRYDEIERIYMDNPTAAERNFAVLEKWRRKQLSSTDLIMELQQPLQACGRMDLAHKLIENASSKSPNFTKSCSHQSTQTICHVQNQAHQEHHRTNLPTSRQLHPIFFLIPNFTVHFVPSLIPSYDLQVLPNGLVIAIPLIPQLCCHRNRQVLIANALRGYDLIQLL